MVKQGRATEMVNDLRTRLWLKLIHFEAIQSWSGVVSQRMARWT